MASLTGFTRACSCRLSPLLSRLSFFTESPHVRRFLSVPLLISVSVSCFAARPIVSSSVRVAVDLTDAPRNIFHSSITLPAIPGEITLVYPKWIPGNHRPSGPIANVAGLHFRAGNQELAWHRAPTEMYSVHVTVPRGAKELRAAFALISADSAGGGGPAVPTNPLYRNSNHAVLETDTA